MDQHCPAVHAHQQTPCQTKRPSRKKREGKGGPSTCCHVRTNKGFQKTRTALVRTRSSLTLFSFNARDKTRAKKRNQSMRHVSLFQRKGYIKAVLLPSVHTFLSIIFPSTLLLYSYLLTATCVFLPIFYNFFLSHHILSRSSNSRFHLSTPSVSSTLLLITAILPQGTADRYLLASLSFLFVISGESVFYETLVFISSHDDDDHYLILVIAPLLFYPFIVIIITVIVFFVLFLLLASTLSYCLLSPWLPLTFFLSFFLPFYCDFFSICIIKVVVIVFVSLLRSQKRRLPFSVFTFSFHCDSSWAMDR